MKECTNSDCLCIWYTFIQSCQLQLYIKFLSRILSTIVHEPVLLVHHSQYLSIIYIFPRKSTSSIPSLVLHPQMFANHNIGLFWWANVSGGLMFTNTVTSRSIQGLCEHARCPVSSCFPSLTDPRKCVACYFDFNHCPRSNWIGSRIEPGNHVTVPNSLKFRFQPKAFTWPHHHRSLSASYSSSTSIITFLILSPIL